MNNKYRRTVIVSLTVISIISIIVYFYISSIIDDKLTIPKGFDDFKIAEIYPTKEGGREWYLNMHDPKQSEHIFLTGNEDISRTSDGAWQAGGPQVKINVDTPEGQEEWHNVEMTGYVRVISLLTQDQLSTDEEEGQGSDINWLARGDRHTNDSPCEGTSLIGTIHTDGTAGWKKEIWHTGGYTDEKGTEKIADSLLNRWIGWKVVMYNINNNSAVKMESYIDDKNDGNWTKVSDIVDDGGWFAVSSNKEFLSAHCGRDKDYIITNSGTIASFRADNVVWDFRNLSIREIDPDK